MDPLEFHWTGNASMLDILPAFRGRTEHNHSKIGNDTIDVMIKGCFNNFDAMACVRFVFCVFYVLVTKLKFFFKLVFER